MGLTDTQRQILIQSLQKTIEDYKNELQRMVFSEKQMKDYFKGSFEECEDLLKYLQTV